MICSLRGMVTLATAASAWLLLLLLLLLPAGTTRALSLLPPTSPPDRDASANRSRRSFLIAAGGAAVVPSMMNDDGVADAASTPPSVYEGMSAFAANKVEESVAIYDSIIRENPKRRPFLWQRGLSLYYAERYVDGAEQFETDVAVNPNDTEEQIWHLLCLAKAEGVGSLDKAREQKLAVGKDRRPVMRLVQKLFLGGDAASEAELIGMARHSDVGSQFYASLYLSLYYESLNDEKSSKEWMVKAIGTEYAKSAGSRDPMVDVAKVAMKRRGWYQ